MATHKARSIGTVGFQNVARGTLTYELTCCGRVGKFKSVCRRETQLSEYALRVSAIIFKAGTVGAAAYYIEAIASQAVLKFTATGADILKQNASVGTYSADPAQLGLPVRNALYQSS
jgi:hypothetical protein